MGRPPGTQLKGSWQVELEGKGRSPAKCLPEGSEASGACPSEAHGPRTRLPVDYEAL